MTVAVSDFRGQEATAMAEFRLDDDFIAKFANQQPAWGPVGRVTYLRTYARSFESVPARIRELGLRFGLVDKEDFWLTVVRVVEGCYEIQRKHCASLRLSWDEKKAQQSAQEMYQLIFDFKFTPPGRGLWLMGTDVIGKIGAAGLNNCSVVSSKDIDTDFAGPFCFMADMSMLGVGVGADMQGAGKVVIQQPQLGPKHIVADTREGWVELIRRVLDSYVGKDTMPAEIDYSLVRPAGAPVKTFGGVSAGPGPLMRCIRDFTKILDPLVGQKITSTAIVDLFNVVGVCVVAGGIRRTAQIMLGSAMDSDFMNLKNPEINKDALESHRWASNNSIAPEIGDDYAEPAAATARNGEPGYTWLQNMRTHGRMIDPANHRDERVVGTNPCQPGFATVLTPEGIRTFDDIDVGSVIWSGKRWTKVIKKVATGDKQVNRYKTRAGIFIGTENHRVVEHGEKIEVADATAIDTAQGETVNRHASKPHDLVAMLDGLLLGDGGVHSRDRGQDAYVILWVGEKDQEWFKIFPGMINREAFDDDTHRTEGHTLRPSELPVTYERQVPDRYFSADAATVCSFLRGLYSANGSLAGGRVTLKASSFDVINRVQQMLSQLGIKSYYTVNAPHEVKFKNGTYTCRQSYDLNITTDRTKFRELIGFLQSDKQKRLDVACECGPATKAPKSTYDIVEVEPIGVLPVYDITVDADEHTYWTGGLLVSNCGEMCLESYELCTLVETFPAQHETFEEYQRTLKYAYLYAKTVTLVPTHDPRTNAVMLRNRRIGVSMSGIVQAMTRHGRREFLRWCDEGYGHLKKTDRVYSQWLCIPESIKLTTVKPSGTTALLCAATPGIHYPHAEYYYRVIRFATDSTMLPAMRAAGYRCVDLSPGEPNTVAVYFPVHEQFFDRSKKDVTLWEQLENVAQMQAYWSDNSVSCTVAFQAHEADDIENALELYETRLKSISFLPLKDHGYSHAPYQEITREEYEAYTATLKPLDFNTATHEVTERFCDGDKCTI